MNTPTVIEYKDIRILTTEQLAQVYETEVNNIKNNFNRNKARFIEGTHYYLLQSEDLKVFKNRVTDSDLVGKNANQLYLWTERGASRHCKILDTNKAWEQFDYLEDTYFRVKEQQINSTPNFNEQLQGAKFIADDMKFAESAKLLMYNTICNNNNVNSNFLPVYGIDSNFKETTGVCLSATELIKRNNLPITNRKLFKLLIDKGYVCKTSRPSSRGENKSFNSFTTKGLKYGKNVTYEKQQRQTQCLFYIDKFIELYNDITKEDVFASILGSLNLEGIFDESF